MLALTRDIIERRWGSGEGVGGGSDDGVGSGAIHYSCWL